MKISILYNANYTYCTNTLHTVNIYKHNTHTTMSQQPKNINPCFIEKMLEMNLKPYQKQGVKFMFECITGLKTPGIQGCILADAMGLGKKIQIITLI